MGQNDNRSGSQKFDPPSGLVKAATIKAADKKNFSVQLAETPAIKGTNPRPSTIPAVYPLIDSSGMFIGSLPAKNTTITVEQELGGKYHFVAFEPESDDLIPDLKPGQMLILSTNRSKISLDLDSHIRIGSDINNIHIFAGSKNFLDNNLITTNFENENHFNQAYREIGGVVKRDIKPNPLAASASGGTKLEDDTYSIGPNVKVIGLDPSFTANDNPAGPTKNPALVEHRELVYEFQYKSAVLDDATEANRYSNKPPSVVSTTTPNRRGSRFDTMSLSLLAPNFLIEEIKGTIVDIFGNILDINRMPLPIGLSPTTTLRADGTVVTTNAQQSYTNIRALERKSIAYHFEVNARKDPNLGSISSTINNDDYNSKLLRSRFYFDIDKEGQFKLNVPASSETGNIPLLVRPENYTNFANVSQGSDGSVDPNQTWFIQSGQPVSQDIFVDSFAAPQTAPSSGFSGFDTQFAHGSIQLVDGTTNADAGPTDRISQFSQGNKYNIRHGTVYHDILQTCSLHQNSDTLENWQLGTAANPVDTTYIKNLTDLVKKTITVSGPGANAGGRSGQINMDGSLEMNIGANSIDRQSLWLDMAGGMIANIGRDRNLRSALVNFDGDVFMQVGGLGITNPDSRFSGDTIPSNGTFDLRIFNGGYCHLFRIDQTGINILSPSKINIYSAQGVTINSDADMSIEAETLTLNGRMVLKAGPSI